jgi:hypothetical protein
VRQWHFDIPFGTQGDAAWIKRAWGKDGIAHSEFRRARDIRLMAGHVGVSPSHLVDEYVFDTQADFEAALGGMGTGPFKQHAQTLVPLIIPATQRWDVYKVTRT